MYKEHYAFEKPDNENAKIWRYMDLAKFLSVLDTHSLFFSPLKKLEDKFEGSITQEDKDRQDSLSEYRKSIYPKYNNYEEREKSKFNRRLRSLVCVNCWSMSEHDSKAMWNSLKNNQGIAIQSTFKRLTESFKNYAENGSGNHENDVYVGMVSYSAHTSNPENHFIATCLHKFPSFEYEHEIRALISRIPIDQFELEGLNLNYKKFNSGLSVSVDLEKLIESIYISPTSESWFSELVKSVMEKCFSNDFSKKVTMSDLSKKPLF